MESAIQTVVDGEASESDEEEEEITTEKVTHTPTSNLNEQTQKKPNLNPQAISISGEASESEDEEDDEIEKIPPLKIDTDSKGDKDDFTNGKIPESPTTPTARVFQNKPKYDSLLHKKLRERTSGIRRHITDSVHQMYIVSAKDLHNTNQQLHKSQALIMDVSHNLKLLTNDLFHLEDKIDIISTCSILPDIHIDVPPSPQTPTRQESKS